MWQPEPGWHPLAGGTGASTLGVWRTEFGGRPVVVKRLARPGPDDPPELSEPRHFAYWRRAADVAVYALVEDTPGLIASPAAVEEDAEGITVTTDWAEDAANTGLFLAAALGRFAGADIAPLPWLARDQLRDRLGRASRRGGWPVLARTPVAALAARLWQRHEELLGTLDELPQVPQHGDPTPANLPGRAEEEQHRVVAIDWSSLGHGPAGADVGLYALQAREALEPLLEAYRLGLPDGIASPEEVRLAARVNAVFTAMTRADWALARVAGGEGALERKFRHPAVAPHLRTLNRFAEAIDALVA